MGRSYPQLALTSMFCGLSLKMMNKKIFLMGFSAIIAVLLSAGALILPTAAQTSGTSATPFRQQIRDIQQDFRQNIEEVRQNLKGEISQLREGALEEFKERIVEGATKTYGKVKITNKKVFFKGNNVDNYAIIEIKVG